MSIVPYNSTNEKNVSRSIANFISAYGIIRLLAKCGCTKIKGVAIKELFTYILTKVFHAGSFSMQQKAEFHVTDEQIKSLYERFIFKLPAPMQRLLQDLSCLLENRPFLPKTLKTFQT